MTMTPRFRRLLIPGLLVALLVVVLVAAISGRADGAEPGQPVDSQVVSRLDDVRITESSGLAVSTKHEDLAYTINDSGSTSTVFAIRISTGDVVGTTTVRDPNFNWLDTEALALRGGTLWVADTGDNFLQRADAALYAFDEPGPGDHTVVPRRYPVTYEDGPQNVEAIAVPPKSGRILLLSKLSAGGVVHRLPARLREGATNVATPTSRKTPASRRTRRTPPTAGTCWCAATRPRRCAKPRRGTWCAPTCCPTSSWARPSRSRTPNARTSSAARD